MTHEYRQIHQKRIHDTLQMIMWILDFDNPRNFCSIWKPEKKWTVNKNMNS